jgi:formate/nitrite transporter
MNTQNMLLPQEIAETMESIGVKKTKMSFKKTACLSILAGAFISFGAIFMTGTITDTSAFIGFGLTKLIGGIVFSLGLILVVVAGAELFTGNSLMTIGWASKKISTSELLRNWMIVYCFNFIGALGTVLLMFLSQQYTFAAGAIGTTALTIAVGKVSLGFVQAIILGILCNIFVCLAVWMAVGATDISGKILAIVPPISAFVAAGFEHSIANMYFVPMGLAIKYLDPAFAASTNVPGLENLTIQSFLMNNLLPVTIGNMIGGGLFIGLIYWFAYHRDGFWN